MESTLIVDDNADACRVMVALLRQMGAEATWVESGDAALKYLQNHVPPLIILDVVMPGMDGFDVLDEIRKDPRLTPVPVILFSSKDEPSYETTAKQRGAAEFWVKSVLLYSNLKPLVTPYLSHTFTHASTPECKFKEYQN
jgi:CheY-like chemotaxis protein